MEKRCEAVRRPARVRRHRHPLCKEHTPYQLDQRIGEHHFLFHDAILVLGRHGVHAKADVPELMLIPQDRPHRRHVAREPLAVCCSSVPFQDSALRREDVNLLAVGAMHGHGRMLHARSDAEVTLVGEREGREMHRVPEAPSLCINSFSSTFNSLLLI